jgi:hypothetical protein
MKVVLGRRRAAADVAARPLALLRGRLRAAARRRLPDRDRADRAVDWVEVDDHDDLARARRVTAGWAATPHAGELVTG